MSQEVAQLLRVNVHVFLFRINCPIMNEESISINTKIFWFSRRITSLEIIFRIVSGTIGVPCFTSSLGNVFSAVYNEHVSVTSSISLSPSIGKQ